MEILKRYVPDAGYQWTDGLLQFADFDYLRHRRQRDDGFWEWLDNHKGARTYELESEPALFLIASECASSEDSVLQFANEYGSFWDRPSRLTEWQAAADELRKAWDVYQNPDATQEQRLRLMWQVEAHSVGLDPLPFWLDDKTMKSQIVLDGDLIDTLWTQMANAHADKRRLKRCEWCNKWMHAKQPGRRTCSTRCRSALSRAENAKNKK